MIDPLSDLLTRIRNGYAAKKTTVLIPFSKQKQAVVKVLVENQYLKSTEEIEIDGQKQIQMTLNYIGKQPAISVIDRISTPGRRVYSPSSAIKSVLSGHGIRIISTSQGVMTDTQAKSKNLGGEVICKVW
jgi:small subunit ribosomal protein S8